MDVIFPLSRGHFQSTNRSHDWAPIMLSWPKSPEVPSLPLAVGTFHTHYSKQAHKHGVAESL